MSDRPSALVVDSAALQECCEVLAKLGSDFVCLERSSVAVADVWPRDLLITSVAAARQLVRQGPHPAEPHPLWVCIHDEDLGDGRRELITGGVDYLVGTEPGRGPDRELLRLLFLHALYTGAERRGEVRLLCSHEVEYLVAGARVRGQLMDLSRAGFRLLGPVALEPDALLELHLPPALDPGPPIGYPARVRRAASALRGPDGRERASIVARFAPTSAGPEHAARIAAVLEAAVATGLPAFAKIARERRFAARHRYAGVAAIRCIDADEYCIVQGAELSLSGMRLAFHPGLDIGAELSIGLHTGRGHPPVVLRGRVRHHDPSGLGVEFSELRPAEDRVLRKLIDELPRLSAVAASEDPDDPRPLLLCSVRV